MRMRCLWLIWSLLTWLAASLCTIGCLLPYWLKGYVHIFSPVSSTVRTSPFNGNVEKPVQLDQTHVWKSDRTKFDAKGGLPTDLGLFRRCGYPVYVNHTTNGFKPQTVAKGQLKFVQPVVWHSGCGHYSQLTSVPHIAWHIAFLTLVSACGVLFFATFFLFILGFTLYLITIRTIYRSCQLMLLVAGLLTLASCVLYPIGWTGNSEVRQACGEEAYMFNLGRCHIGWAYVLTCSGGLLSLFAALLPVIFPKHSNQRMQSLRSHDLLMQKSGNPTACCQCFGTSAQQMKSSTDASIPFFTGPVPSPANSLDAESVCFHPSSQRPESMFLLPRPGGLSPTRSMSPVPSIMQDRMHSGQNEDRTGVYYGPMAGQRPPSTFTPSSSIPQYPYMCNYVPSQQRYSTGALLSHYQLVPTGVLPTNLHTNQRISVAVNADPLIYVAEEEEILDAGEPHADRMDAVETQMEDQRQPDQDEEHRTETTQTSPGGNLSTQPQEASLTVCLTPEFLPKTSVPMSDRHLIEPPSYTPQSTVHGTGVQTIHPGETNVETTNQHRASVVL